MTVRSYNEFRTITKALEGWDPNSQYIAKDLTLRNKSQKNTCCQRFFAIFRASKSSQAVTAAKIINSYTMRYVIQLAGDKDTVRSLKKFNKSMSRNLVRSNAAHGFRSNKKRAELHKHCKDIHTLCTQLLQAKTLSKSASSNSTLKESISSHTNTALDSKRATKIPPFLNSKDLKKFITKMNPASAKEATELFEDLRYALANSHYSKVLDVANGNALLIKIGEIKHKFADPINKRSEQNLRKAALRLRIEIRKRFFSSRIKRMKAQVKLFEANVDGTLRAGSAVPEVIRDWKNDLRKYKPISIPKYFHCTKPEYVNLIIQHKEGIIPQPPGLRSGYPGAFASSVPEQGKGAGSYGPFCFAISDYVEERALAENQAPITTNVNYFSDLGGFQTDRDPIYVGDAAPKAKKDPAKHKGQPKIWFGFKQSIILRKVAKIQDPLEYYRNTTFSLFAHMADNDHEFAKIDDVSLKELSDRNIRILHAEDFRELVDLVQRSQHFVLPAKWKSQVKAPAGCTLAQQKQHYIHKQQPFNITYNYSEVPLKDLEGVIA